MGTKWFKVQKTVSVQLQRALKDYRFIVWNRLKPFEQLQFALKVSFGP